jgi:hypothetical protein
MAHSNSSSRNFLRAAWTEDNVRNMMRRIEDDAVVMECVVD